LTLLGNSTAWYLAVRQTRERALDKPSPSRPLGPMCSRHNLGGAGTSRGARRWGPRLGCRPGPRQDQLSPTPAGVLAKATEHPVFHPRREVSPGRLHCKRAARPLDLPRAPDIGAAPRGGNCAIRSVHAQYEPIEAILHKELVAGFFFNAHAAGLLQTELQGTTSRTGLGRRERSL